MKRRLTERKGLLGGAVLLLLAFAARAAGCGEGALSSIASTLWFALNQNSGGFDRAHFEAVVEEVRRRPFPPGEVRTFRLTDLANPRSLADAEDETRLRGGGAGLVWARRAADGKLQVTIETRDLGHAGEYGFAYSEIPLGTWKLPGEGTWQQADPPGHVNILGKRIDERWWEVLYNLD